MVRQVRDGSQRVRRSQGAAQGRRDDNEVGSRRKVAFRVKHGCSIFELRESPTAGEWRIRYLLVWYAIFPTNVLHGLKSSDYILLAILWIRDGVSHLRACHRAIGLETLWAIDVL